jgi:hypothetical protein
MAAQQPEVVLNEKEPGGLEARRSIQRTVKREREYGWGEI